MHQHIFRGYSLKQELKYGQYHELARRVVESAVYIDRDHSYGDGYVWRCANREVGWGNLGTWVEVDMNHHMVYVAAQLRKLVNQVVAGVSASDLLALAV